MTEEYINLGLPSGTVWKNTNEDGYYEFDDAVSQFGFNFPSKEQWEELKNLCQWEWIGDGYRVTGPNGHSIVLPAEGYHSCNEDVNFLTYDGNYWSSMPKDSDYARGIYFDPSGVHMFSSNRYYGFFVRLVK